MDFIVYNTMTGKILRTGQCPEVTIPIQAGKDESVIKGVADDICDLIDIETKQILKEAIIPKAQIKEEFLAEAPTREREFLIQKKMKEILHKQAEQELINEGKIKEN